MKITCVTYIKAIISWLNHPENEQEGMDEEDFDEPQQSESDDGYVDSKAEAVFNILGKFNKRDDRYEG